MQEPVQLAGFSKQRGSKSRQVSTGGEETKETEAVATKRLFPDLHFNGSEMNYDLNLMILNTEL